MSSFIGHSLAAVGIYNAVAQPLSKPARRRWLGWLIILSLAPDIDYLITSLRINAPEPIRVTHSLLGSLTLPLLTILTLILIGYRGSILRSCSLQAIVTGLSHLIMDLLVGVTPLALAWPLSFATTKLPLGILPSAGRIDLHNPLLYYNTLIEVGVIAPIVIAVYLLRRRYIATLKHKLLIGGLGAISLVCMVWAASLTR